MKKQGARFIKLPENSDPNWKKIIVESKVPEKLHPLRELSKNLWWSWNDECRELFNDIDPRIWEKCEHNPIILLEETSLERFSELESDDSFILRMTAAYKQFTKYLEERETLRAPKVAYFSMEYGIHSSLKIYSGGLGILAGDYLKEASDSKVDMVAVGLLYRFGYFKQIVSKEGEQIAHYDAENFSKLAIQPVMDKDGSWVTVSVEMPGRVVLARVWVANVGNVKLYLLDTDHEANQGEDKFITHHLYGGDNENRLKQEMVLGLGGIRVLEKLNIEANIYHCNEGHAAFIGLERIKTLHKEAGLTFAEAKEVVRGSTLFTTHTPVPAGHDSFYEDLFTHYMGFFPKQLDISQDEFVMLGKADKKEDHFNMSYLAANMSQAINGVSKLHGNVSREVLADLYKGFLPEELDNIGYVTNGVHYPTWTAPEWIEVHKKYLPFEEIREDIRKYDEDRIARVCKNIYKAPDAEIWDTKTLLRGKMINYIKQRFTDTQLKRNENPKFINEALSKLNPEALTIGFARRFATYKRANLLFKNLDRLSKIVNNPDRPVQFIFAGKAHPADKAGQDLIKYIVEVSHRPEFIGKVLFIQNYDMNLAKQLVQGCDIWLNTPTRPLEASGTSGEKAIMNGTLHFSVLDGWWVEGYKKDAGWALPLERSFDLQELQDELDVETIYGILENEVIPSYYYRNDKNIPVLWIDFIKNNFADVSPHFSTKRMLKDYFTRYYTPLSLRADKIQVDNYAPARELAAWKEKISKVWDDIDVVNKQLADGITNTYQMGQNYPSRVVLDLKGLSTEEVGVELIIATDDDTPKLVHKQEFKAEAIPNGLTQYTLNLQLKKPGTYNYGLRVFPKYKSLPHRLDFKYLKWI
jgi:alpha-glucan phosphorylase-like protein